MYNSGVPNQHGHDFLLIENDILQITPSQQRLCQRTGFNCLIWQIYLVRKGLFPSMIISTENLFPITKIHYRKKICIQQSIEWKKHLSVFNWISQGLYLDTALMRGYYKHYIIFIEQKVTTVLVWYSLCTMRR